MKKQIEMMQRRLERCFTDAGMQEIFRKWGEHMRKGHPIKHKNATMQAEKEYLTYEFVKSRGMQHMCPQIPTSM